MQRDGDDLRMGLGIPLVDALLGFSTPVEHVDGHLLPVEKTGVTSCGSVMRLSGEGMPRKKGGFGDLYITFTVEFPTHIPGGEAQKNLIRSALKF